MAAPTTKVIRIQQVLEMTCLTRGTLYRYVKANEFPLPIQLGPRLNGWYEHEVREWLDTRPRGLHAADDGRRLRSVPRLA